MKKIILFVLTLTLLAGQQAYSHSGRTDKNGGHNCSAKSKKKGLCTGYHYHKKKNGEVERHSHEMEKEESFFHSH